MRKKLKILYIIPAEGFGGAERQAIFHINHLPLNGIDVVAVSGPGKKVQTMLDCTRSKIYHCPHMPQEYARPFNLFYMVIYGLKTVFSWIRTLIFLSNIIKKENIDLIVASRVVGWLLAASLSRIFNMPSIWRFGSCVHGNFRRYTFHTLGTLFPPDWAIANCQAVADSIAPLIKTKTTLVFNGIEAHFLDFPTDNNELRISLNVPASVPVVGLAIRPSPDKGMDFLSEVIDTVNSRNKRIHFCIAGEFGWRKAIQAAFAEKGLADSISFLGHIQDIRSFYLGCDIIALTSRSKSIEGLPNSLLEAMALGRPVIATDTGGISELIDNNVSGILIESTNPRKFANELLALASDPIKRKQIGQAARNIVAQRYQSSIVMHTLSQCIIKVADTCLTKRSENNHINVFKGTCKLPLSNILLLFITTLQLIITGAHAQPNPAVQKFKIDITISDSLSSIGNCKWIPIVPEDFHPLKSYSGHSNYYSVLHDSGNLALIHAEYTPPKKTVTLGYQFPKTWKIKRIAWDWRITKPPSGSQEDVKGKNDSGASVYILFKEKMNIFIIKYIFSERLSVGTFFPKSLPSPLQKMQMVVKSSLADTKPGEWVHIEADICTDFESFFGFSFVPDSRGIGILTDGDQTVSNVKADYANFKIGRTE